jgi:hypothetical protein
MVIAGVIGLLAAIAAGALRAREKWRNAMAPNVDRDISAARNREHWKQEFDLTDALAMHIEAFVQTIQVRRGDVLGVVVVALLLRLCYGLESISLLSARGYFTEAMAQFRSLMEAAVKLTAMRAKPELLAEYMMQDKLLRKRMLKDVLALRKSGQRAQTRHSPMRTSKPSSTNALPRSRRTRRSMESRSFATAASSCGPGSVGFSVMYAVTIGLPRTLYITALATWSVGFTLWMTTSTELLWVRSKARLVICYSLQAN